MAENDPNLNPDNPSQDTAAADVTSTNEAQYQLVPPIDPATLSVPFSDNAMALIQQEKEQLLKELDASIQWYSIKAPERGRNARLIRSAMIFCGGVAALLPSLSQSPVFGVQIPPVLTTVMIVMTATLYAYERFYGDADAWMRFEMARQRLLRLKEEFSINWLEIEVAAGGDSDLGKELAELIRVSAAHHNIIQTETEQWIISFKSGMKTTVPQAAQSERSSS